MMSSNVCAAQHAAESAGLMETELRVALQLRRNLQAARRKEQLSYLATTHVMGLTIPTPKRTASL